MKNNNEMKVDETLKVLKENDDVVWEIYERYAQQIIINKGKYGSNSHLFQVKKPLLVYSSIGKVKCDSSTTEYDLRFAGQSVGLVKVDCSGEVSLTVSESQAKRAKEKFNFVESESFDGVGWEKDEAIAFRRFYLNNESSKKIAIKSQEHRIESEMLKEFSKRTRKEDKKLCNIQPVRLGGKFFQLTTPLKGSTHIPTISLTPQRNGATGGGIDILARVKHSARDSRLAIIELKDENRKDESQEVAMYQALIYATFIAGLLRSKSGKYWRYIFRDREKRHNELRDVNDFSDFSKIKDMLSEVPDTLDLDVVTLMPKPQICEYSQEGDLSDVKIDDLNVTLHLYTLYYETDAKGNPISFSGTLKESLMK